MSAQTLKSKADEMGAVIVAVKIENLGNPRHGGKQMYDLY